MQKYLNKKILFLSFLFLTALSLVGASAVSAHGWGLGRFYNLDPQEVAVHQQTMFEHKAELLGVSVDEVKSYWAEGKNMKDIIKELGLDNEELNVKMKAAHQAQMQEHLQSLVANGVITQEQADQRLEFAQEHFKNGDFGKGFKRGFGRGFGCPH